ncbi:MAG: hypothetical protein N3B01_07515, partial [Verrucomicrobiae bacterium]|nr:hypothetical protein [Verrucomicrobiae bacterium]
MKQARGFILFMLAASTCPQDLPRWELGPFTRGDDPKPILGPNLTAAWEAGGVSSPSAITRDGKVYLFYAATDKSVWRIGLATSADGRAFERAPHPVLAPSTDPQRLAELKGGCDAPRVVATEQGVYVMSYIQHGERGSRIAIASSRDLLKWHKHGPALGEAPLPSPGAGVIVSRLVNGKAVAAQIGGRYWMFWGAGKINLAASTDLARWTNVAEAVLAPRKDEFDADALSPGAALITERGLLLIYHGRAGNITCTGQALFDPTQPTRLLLRSRLPTLRPQMPFERPRKGPAVTAITAVLPLQEKWLAYYSTAAGYIGLAAFDPAEYWAARNPGLAEPQEPATLPVSRTPPTAPPVS